MSSIMEAIQNREYKTRNTLTMNQRVKVIKAYKHTPNYQRLAERFFCSAKQIKNIILNKNEVMNYYKNERANKKADEIAIRRQEKINFLGKVVYEFLLRALYLRMPVGTTIIRQKAFEVKEAIAIENFSPNQAWLDDFKATYNRLDLTIMMEQLPDDMNKRRSINCMDLIEYVSQEEKDEKSKYKANDKYCKRNREEDEYGNSKKQSRTALATTTTKQNGDPYEVLSGHYEDNGLIKTQEFNTKMNGNYCKVVNEPIVLDLDSDEEEILAERNVGSLLKTMTQNDYSSGGKSKSTTINRATLSPLPDIHSYLEALRHLKVLEDFAMIEENYRAIGLITQLELIFKNPPKLKRITT